MFKAVLFVLLVLTYSCSIQNDFTSIKFGNGGGYTGALAEYTINSEGQVFSKINSESKLLVKLSSKQIKEVKRNIKKTSFEDSFNHPFNIYYFIEVEKNGNKNRITWGDPKYAVPSNIQKIYDSLIKTIK